MTAREGGVGPIASMPSFLDPMVPGPTRSNFVFLSPHLDDAVLSCGALIVALAQHAPTLVATFFSEATPRPWSPAGKELRAHLWQ